MVLFRYLESSGEVQDTVGIIVLVFQWPLTHLSEGTENHRLDESESFAAKTDIENKTCQPTYSYKLSIRKQQDQKGPFIVCILSLCFWKSEGFYDMLYATSMCKTLWKYWVCFSSGFRKSVSCILDDVILFCVSGPNINLSSLTQYTYIFSQFQTFLN